jgi:hypothetical protein
MKWTHKGHEFDKIWFNYEMMADKKYYLFGAGFLGKKLGKVLCKFNLLEGYIDNDVNRHGEVFLTRNIISFNEYLVNNHDNTVIIVSVSSDFSDNIAEQIEDAGLKHGKDYLLYSEFHDMVLPVLLTYGYGKTYVELAQIALTERCSLKCKKCAHACYNVDSKASDMALSEVFQSATTFFRKVDYIDEFVLIGGEPLLYRQLAKVVVYIGQRYRNQMGIYSITTNGTIVPSKEVLDACKEYDVLFRISNYSKTIPRLKPSYKKLTDTLDEYGITYELGDPEIEWIDYGFDYLEKPFEPENLIRTFDECHTPCKEIRGSKLYYCVMARSVSDNLKLNEGEDDFLDLDRLNGDNCKKELLEFCMGYSDKGYLDMCRRCHGMKWGDYSIPAAEQL